MSDDLFTLIAARIPDPAKPFLIAGDGTAVTYGEMLALSARLAGLLVRLGVAPDDRVAVQVDKSPEALILYLACLRAGAVFLPLNTAYTLAEVEYFLSDAGPRLVVCRPRDAEAMAALVATLGTGICRTLGAKGEGSLMAEAAGLPADFANVRARRRRPRRDPLYLGHDRPVEGCDAQPSQPRLERPGAGRYLALHRGGRAAARAADLPHPRPVRGDQRDAAWPAASMIFLPRFDAGRGAGNCCRKATVDDGGADLLCPAGCRTPGSMTRAIAAASAAVRLGLGAAARRYPPRFPGRRAPATPSWSATA
jgi:hypothetical protein